MTYEYVGVSVFIAKFVSGSVSVLEALGCSEGTFIVSIFLAKSPKMVEDVDHIDSHVFGFPPGI